MKNHKRTTTMRLITLFLITAVLSACGTAATPEPTLDMNEFATHAVETIEANATATALAIPTNTPEPTYTPVSLPTETPESITVLPQSGSMESGLLIVNPGDEQTAGNPQDTNIALPAVPAEVAAPVNMVAAPTATPLPLVGDKASYDSQTPLDGSHVEAGSEFDITWYLLNTGTTTWTTDYCMRYFTGTNFTKTSKPRFYLNEPVPPNTVGACSVDAIAPEKPGTYTMSVVLGNENDENFFIVDLTIVVD